MWWWLNTLVHKQPSSWLALQIPLLILLLMDISFGMVLLRYVYVSSVFSCLPLMETVGVGLVVPGAG